MKKYRELFKDSTESSKIEPSNTSGLKDLKVDYGTVFKSFEASFLILNPDSSKNDKMLYCLKAIIKNCLDKLPINNKEVLNYNDNKPDDDKPNDDKLDDSKPEDYELDNNMPDDYEINDKLNYYNKNIWNIDA
ncbi:15337_t:CDS:2 [Cetraspora pellucida]|uniref:15337_t:CDS:1 n=1 Tax=Cetraspora pellucida TaxID=1433469 RepID=A0A9N9J2W1_9GLOM|nr:15337_t:CDS:2 [Cetraspora pellucida]